MECGTFFYEPLGKEARYYRGWGYEIVDASDKWDIIIKRDVLGLVLHEFFGEKLYGKHPAGIRYTIYDGIYKDECGPIPLAPILTNQFKSGGWYDACGHFSLGLGYGDGEGAMIFTGCAWGGIYYNPQECFIAIESGGPHLTDIIVTAFIVSANFLFTPDFTKYDLFRLLGQPRREGDQWRWEDPFILVVPQK